MSGVNNVYDCILGHFAFRTIIGFRQSVWMPATSLTLSPQAINTSPGYETSMKV
jgi:hypothetical protein